MQRLFTIALVLACAFSLSCSKSGGEANSNANADQQNQFAEITDANQALQIGSDLLENNETEKAIDALLRATELNPDLGEAWFKLGIAYSLIEKQQALDAQTDVNVPGDAQKTGRPNSEKAFRKAIEAYKKILAQNPDDDVSQYNLGRAYNKLNEDENAAKALKQAVKLKPDDTDYQTELGAILIKLAQYREAIAPLKKALELDPENSRAADLLEDAEAGRNRIDYSGPKPNGNSNSNANASANSNANVSIANSNTSSNTAKPAPTAKSTPKPEIKEKPTPKPNKHEN
jgi:tetratricopeptide (TPR) repeat protein